MELTTYQVLNIYILSSCIPIAIASAMLEISGSDEGHLVGMFLPFLPAVLLVVAMIAHGDIVFPA